MQKINPLSNIERESIEFLGHSGNIIALSAHNNNSFAT